ncbi:MAG: class I SAM-dependent methyltransferase [Gammaproteobacteria bacterium]|nr:class I SAM-dependent methyltransferase [Gammaproteobacteria bacterium]
MCDTHERVWDCATGSGQAARKFTPYFDSVVASDASYEQTRNAESIEGLSYLSCLAEQTPFQNHCFDLISVAQAAHWFRLEEFYIEVKRLLKPQGVLAVWTYNLMRINPDVDEIIWHLYNDVLGAYWPFERKLVENGYRDLYFPLQKITVPKFSMSLDWSFDHLLGYLSTWSAVKRYREKNKSDPVERLSTKLQSAWGNETVRSIDWPLSIRAGHMN